MNASRSVSKASGSGGSHPSTSIPAHRLRREMVGAGPWMTQFTEEYPGRRLRHDCPRPRYSTIWNKGNDAGHGRMVAVPCCGSTPTITMGPGRSGSVLDPGVYVGDLRRPHPMAILRRRRIRPRQSLTSRAALNARDPEKALAEASALSGLSVPLDRESGPPVRWRSGGTEASPSPTRANPCRYAATYEIRLHPSSHTGALFSRPSRSFRV